MGITIELLGPPGAGKTTFAAALERELANGGRDVTVATRGTDAGSPNGARLRTKLLLASTELATHPGPSMQAIGAIFTSDQAGWGASARRALAWLVAQRLAYRARTTSGVSILDEGALQALWSLGLFGDHHRISHRWVERPDTWRIGDIIVVLLPSLHELETRLVDRADPHSRIERLRGSQRLDALRRGHRLTRAIARMLPSLGVSPGAVIWLGDNHGRDGVMAVMSRVHALEVAAHEPVMSTHDQPEEPPSTSSHRW